MRFRHLETPAVANTVLVKYIQEMYDTRVPHSRASHAILCVQWRFRSLRGQLKPAWDSVKSWALELPLSMRTPASDRVVQVLVMGALLKGLVTHRVDSAVWLSLGIYIMTMYHGLLRPAEGAALLAGQVSLPASSVLCHVQKGILALKDTKTKACFGKWQFAVIDDQTCLRWIEWWCLSVCPGHRLFPHPLGSVRRHFQVLLKEHGLHKCGYTLASFRAGRATHLYLQGISIDRLAFLGRWAATTSWKHYVQEAAACLALSRIGSKERRRRHAFPLLLRRHPCRGSSSAVQSCFALESVLQLPQQGPQQT